MRPPDSPVHGILQARVLQRLAMPSPGGLPHPGVGSVSPELACRFFTAERPGKPLPVPIHPWCSSSSIDQETDPPKGLRAWLKVPQLGRRGARLLSNSCLFCFNFIFKIIYLRIYFWLHWVFVAVPRPSLAAEGGGRFLVAVRELLPAAASLVAKHRL